MIEVRDREKPAGMDAVTDLQINSLDYAKQHNVTVLPAYLSVSGFTKKAKEFCLVNGIGLAEAVASYP
ncbi:MAG: hypothetical protein AAF639_23395 [Chloroflexota bacterium]